MSSTAPEILFEEIAHLGLITLNRQQALNALNHNMFLALEQQLSAWEKANHIKAVVIRAAEGRAFCAGGDIRHAYELKKNNDPSLSLFFRDEYRLNRHIFHYSKPFIALLDGITMGGGVGISLHGSHRIGTERLVFSMPETGIGFYPDVGTTYHLSRMPYYIGFYLGLASARIDYADCLALGIIQHIVASHDLTNIIDRLATSTITDRHSVTAVLQSFALTSKPSELLTHQTEIAHIFSKKTVEDMVFSLENSTDTWCQQLAKMIQTKSPTSLKVTLAALQKAATQPFDQCMDMELRLTHHFIEGHDFFEGIRAAIIDKDQAPHWQPGKLMDLKSSEVEKYFIEKTDLINQ